MTNLRPTLQQAVAITTERLEKAFGRDGEDLLALVLLGAMVRAVVDAQALLICNLLDEEERTEEAPVIVLRWTEN